MPAISECPVRCSRRYIQVLCAVVSASAHAEVDDDKLSTGFGTWGFLLPVSHLSLEVFGMYVSIGDPAVYLGEGV